MYPKKPSQSWPPPMGAGFRISRKAKGEKPLNMFMWAQRDGGEKALGKRCARKGW